MEQLTILVVDDNHINRLYLKTILTQWQHHVIEVEDGQSAIQACQQQLFDWVLMDIRMQPMDGITATKSIKKIPDFKTIPITAVSAERVDCDAYSYFNQCLIKPITKQDLKATLMGIVDAKKLNHSLSSVVKPTENRIFDEQQALAISHQDTKIVAHLRQLLVAELPQQMEHINQLQQQRDWQALNQQLHRLLGSARVCAAVSLEQSLQTYKNRLTKPKPENSIEQLKLLQESAQALMKFVTRSS